MTVTDQMYEQMRGRMWFAARITTGVSVVDLLAGHGGHHRRRSCFAVFNAAMGGERHVQAGVRRAASTRASISRWQQLFTGPLNYFRGAVTSATNLAVLLPMMEPKSFVGRLLAMTDLFLIW